MRNCDADAEKRRASSQSSVHCSFSGLLAGHHRRALLNLEPIPRGIVDFFGPSLRRNMPQVSVDTLA